LAYEFLKEEVLECVKLYWMIGAGTMNPE